ncbi:OPRM1 [Lepeophtheirus salmonis]|uniref:OPRM1 n=1 Tax=Lepeophtheirus salmonis TaxID=72036 RepID=A0A7R8CHW1_LEPSM|nr:OPRM1 [Lepeophtheirus salmonis]CAF2827107.1 OPRM1 [Lepeophtheirus salmonis]
MPLLEKGVLSKSGVSSQGYLSSAIFCEHMDRVLHGIPSTFPCADNAKAQGSAEEHHTIHLLETVLRAKIFSEEWMKGGRLGIVQYKGNHPKSYWVLNEGSQRILRQNKSYVKPHCIPTSSDLEHQVVSSSKDHHVVSTPQNQTNTELPAKGVRDDIRTTERPTIQKRTTSSADRQVWSNSQAEFLNY